MQRVDCLKLQKFCKLKIGRFVNLIILLTWRSWSRRREQKVLQKAIYNQSDIDSTSLVCYKMVQLDGITVLR